MKLADLFGTIRLESPAIPSPQGHHMDTDIHETRFGGYNAPVACFWAARMPKLEGCAEGCDVGLYISSPYFPAQKPYDYTTQAEGLPPTCCALISQASFVKKTQASQ